MNDLYMRLVLGSIYLAVRSVARMARQWLTKQQTSGLICRWMIKSDPVFCRLDVSTSVLHLSKNGNIGNISADKISLKGRRGTGLRCQPFLSLHQDKTHGVCMSLNSDQTVS